MGLGVAVDVGPGVAVGVSIGVVVGTGVAVGVGAGTRVLVGSALEPVTAVDGPGSSPQETAIARAHRAASNPKYPSQRTIRGMQNPRPPPYIQAAIPGRALYTSRCFSMGRWSSVAGGLDYRRHAEGYFPNPLSLEGEGGSFKVTGVQLNKPPETERCQRHPGQLNVIWDNAPAHRSEAVREYQGTPGLALRLMKLPGHSPDATPVRRSGHGRDWKRRETCAWGPRPRRRRGLAASSLV